MIFKSLLYALYTILSAFVESIRIKLGWGKTPNVKHAISVFIGVLGYAILIYIFKMNSILDLSFFTINCILIRGVFYDPALNTFRKKEMDYESPTTDNKTDSLEKLLKLGFWKQRRLYVYSFITSTIVYSILKFI